MKIGSARVAGAVGRTSAFLMCAALVGCAQHQVRRLLTDQRFEEGVAVAEAARRPVRGATARALAKAYVALSQLGEARDILQEDFRRGGELKSLLALAKLESSMGLDGIATTRWGTLAQLDPLLVENDPLACRLLLSRGASRQLWREFAAADRDLELVEALCSDEELRVFGEEAKTRRAEGYDDAVEDVVARHAPVGCDPEPCRSWGGDVRDAGDSEALKSAAGGVEAYVMRAAREFAGRGGVAPMSDLEVQAQLGHASISELDAALANAGDDVEAYIRFRVSRVWSDAALPEAERQTMRVRVEASSGTSAHGWMLRWLEGDVTFAEFDVSARLRAMLAARSAGGEERSAPASAGASGVKRRHWAEMLPVSDDSVRLLLVLARMLARKGQGVAALRVRARVVAAVGGADSVWAVEDGEALVEREIVAVLEEGRPWSALYLTSMLDSSMARRRLMRACWGWIGLSGALCDGACGEAEDRAVVASTLDDSALLEFESMVLTRAILQAEGGEVERADCGLAWREVGSDSEWASLVRSAGASDPPTKLASMATLSEEDILLGCRTRLLAERLAAGGGREELETLAWRREGAADTGSSMEAESEAATLLGMGAPRRALQRLEDAAALSHDPRAVWVRGYVSASAIGAREVSLRSLREVVLYSSPGEAGVARRLLVIAPWRDLLLGEQGPAEETERRIRRRALEQLFESASSTERWETVEWLVRTLVDTPGASLAGMLRVVAELQPLVPLERHSTLIDRLFAVGGTSPARGGTLSDALSSCGAPSHGGPSSEDGVQCLGRILRSTPVDAARAMAPLLAALPATQRGAVILWMLDAPGGWSPSAEELFPNPEINLRMALGLPIVGWVELEGPRLDSTLLR